LSLAQRLRGFDRRLAEIQSHTFYAPALERDSVVADLGASTAGFSQAIVARFGARCFAAEPLPDNFKLIQPQPRITAFRVALSGTDGRIALGVRDTFHTSASFGSYDSLPERDRIEVDSVTLEGFRRLAGVERFDLVKVDIEGAEFAMFEAAHDDTLRSIDQITVEFHDFLDPSREPEVQAIIRRLAGLGFAALRFTRRHHGDMLFLNRRFIKLADSELLWFRHAVRGVRGVGRLIERLA
jgi:FkbM family methyltransferase